ncbi:MAG: DUF421 domain-containing protein [Clostridia bacterium]
MNEILRVVINTLISFAYLFIIAKLLGKKQIAQLEFTDYVLGISIGSIAAQMTFDTEIPFYFFLIAMTIFMVLALILNYLEITPTFLKTIIKGKPHILIEDGKINYKEIKKVRFDMNDLLSLCRLKNYFDIDEIAFAILETNGQLSILPKSENKPATLEHLKIKDKKSSLSIDFIIEGKIVEKALNQAEKSKDWLYKKLNISSKNDLKNIVLATYDEENDEIIVHNKNL